MNRKILAASSILIVGLILAAAVLVAWNQIQPSTAGLPTRYTYSILNTYPHDTGAYTQGLVFSNGSLFESTGEYGTSSLRRVNLTSGDILQEYKLPNEYYAEGLAAVNGSLIQLTWLNRVGFVYDQDTFSLQRNFSYTTEGWGLTYNDSNLIMSDGTSRLTFLNPDSFEIVKQISVKDGNNSITKINELEFINGYVYANIWLTQEIAIINPQNGQVKGWIDLSGIYQSDDFNAVLNGIAYDSQTGGLFVTGKNWPHIYEIKITPTN